MANDMRMTTLAATTILALDLGKFKSVACVYDLSLALLAGMSTFLGRAHEGMDEAEREAVNLLTAFTPSPPTRFLPSCLESPARKHF